MAHDSCKTSGIQEKINEKTKVNILVFILLAPFYAHTLRHMGLVCCLQQRSNSIVTSLNPDFQENNKA